ncbi:MAG: single-stranded DNA-binding protein [bacterium]|nr:single-stranded DNA-binding protein [bacterium]
MAEYKVPQINRVHITGHLTADPDLRYTPDGQPICNFQIASNRRYMDKKTSEWQETTTFIRVVSWGKTAERMGERLRKGSAVYVEGRLQSRAWETPDGQKRSVIEIAALRVQDLSKLPGEKEEISEEAISEVEDKGDEEERKGEKGELPF